MNVSSSSEQLLKVRELLLTSSLVGFDLVWVILIRFGRMCFGWVEIQSVCLDLGWDLSGTYPLKDKNT